MDPEGCVFPKRVDGPLAGGFHIGDRAVSLVDSSVLKNPSSASYLSKGTVGTIAGPCSGHFEDANERVAVAFPEGHVNMRASWLEPPPRRLEAGVFNKETPVSKTWTGPCGSVNPESAKFCNGCGAKKPADAAGWTGPCGNVNPASAKFCERCGTPKPTIESQEP